MKKRKDDAIGCSDLNSSGKMSCQVECLFFMAEKKNIITLNDELRGCSMKDRQGLDHACAWCVRNHVRGLMWSKEFVYHRCHERELIAVLNALTAEAHGRNCSIESSDSSLLHVEFPPSWLKYQHIAAIFLSTRAQSFNNLQNERSRWKVIRVT